MPAGRDEVLDQIERVTEELRQIRHDATRDRQAAEEMAKQVGINFQLLIDIRKAVTPEEEQESPLVDALKAIFAKLESIEHTLAHLASG